MCYRCPRKNNIQVFFKIFGSAFKSSSHCGEAMLRLDSRNVTSSSTILTIPSIHIMIIEVGKVRRDEM